MTRKEAEAKIAKEVAAYSEMMYSTIMRCRNSACKEWIVKEGREVYCSDECAKVGDKAHKRKWWKLHGNAWRATRMETK
jgi:hypothetical protein